MKCNVEQLETVLHVACLTEDRSGDEQRAMLDLALKVDKERASFASSNPREPQVPIMVWTVEHTYQPSEGRKVGLRGEQRKQLEALHAKFVPCAACGVRAGDHPLKCLADDIEKHRRACGPQEGRLV